MPCLDAVSIITFIHKPKKPVMCRLRFAYIGIKTNGLVEKFKPPIWIWKTAVNFGAFWNSKKLPLILGILLKKFNKLSNQCTQPKNPPISLYDTCCKVPRTGQYLTTLVGSRQTSYSFGVVLFSSQVVYAIVNNYLVLYFFCVDHLRWKQKIRDTICRKKS